MRYLAYDLGRPPSGIVVRVVKMLIASLALIAVGVLLTAGALASWPWDFAVAVMPGWHVTIFPPPLWFGVLLLLSGLAMLASVQWR